MMENGLHESWPLQTSMIVAKPVCKINDENRRKHSTEDSFSKSTDNTFCHSIRILLYSCRVVGLFYTRNHFQERPIYYNIPSLYHLFVCFILACNVIRSLTVYKRQDPLDEVLFFKVQLSIWSFESTVKACVIYVYCFRKDGFGEFFRKWNEFYHVCSPDKLTICVMKISTIICWGFVLVNTLGILLSFLLSDELGKLFLIVSWPNVLAGEITLALKLMMTFVIFLNSAAAVFPVALLVVLSLAIIKRFRDFNAEFKSHISPQGEFCGELEEYRLRHQKLCRLVDVFDRVFMIVVAAVFVADTVMFCMILYNLIYTTMPFSYRILNLFWLTMMLFHLCVVSVVGAWLNVSAHSPLVSIYNIRVSGSIQAQHLEMTMFISRLTGTDIGLTSGRMFVIDKPTILTVVGMMITYFIVMLEFKQEDPPIPTVNCTCSRGQ